MLKLKCITCGGIVSRTSRSGMCKVCFAPYKNKHKIGIPINLGQKNHAWAGDKVKYKGLHKWVIAHKSCDKKCEVCKLEKPLDLANKGIYNRDFENWEWLCRRCHMIKDGRIVGIIKNLNFYKNRQLKNKNND